MCAASQSIAQTPEERRLPPIQATVLAANEKITIDGKLDDAVWQRIQPMSTFYEHRPRDGVAAKFPSEVRIAIDKHALYIGLTAIDPDTSKIEAPLVRRDQVQGNQDFFAVHIDPTGARKFAQIFRVNAAGAIGDGLLNEDTGNEDYSPDFEFEARTAMTPQGWTAELRIPFSTLRYSDPPAENWSIQVFRGIARDEQYRFANARIPRDANCTLCYAQSLIGMRELPAGRELTVTPQMTLRRTSERQDSGARNTKNNVVIGTDIKYRPRADLVFDATINPDFSQVELDTPQLAASAQFALFFPEKRPFFLEGADILSTPFGGAIYTRSITDPAWGARLTQRSDGSDFTILTVRDDGKGFILLPGALNTGFANQDTKSQATIGRFRSHHDTWSVGALITDRSYERAEGKASAYNRVAGVDGVWRPNAESRIRAQVLVSDTNDPRNPRAPGIPRTDDAALVDYNFRDAKWNIDGGLEYVGTGFRADNGFFSQVGYTNFYQNFQRKWLDVGGFNEVSPYLNVGRKIDDSGRLLYQQFVPGIFLGVAGNTNMGAEIRSNTLIRFRNDGTPLKRDQLYFWLEASPATWLSRYYVETAVGDRADLTNNRVRRGYYIGANATLRLSNRWEIEPRIDDANLGTHSTAAGKDSILRERALQVTSVYHFTARDNLRFIGQYNSVKRNRDYYAASVSPKETTQTLSVVYGHLHSLGSNIYFGATTTKSVDALAASTRRQNELFVKASWAFDLAGLIS